MYFRVAGGPDASNKHATWALAATIPEASVQQTMYSVRTEISVVTVVCCFISLCTD